MGFAVRAGCAFCKEYGEGDGYEGFVGSWFWVVGFNV